MALKQIGGLIKSQPLNENFKYLDDSLTAHKAETVQDGVHGMGSAAALDESEVVKTDGSNAVNGPFHIDIGASGIQNPLDISLKRSFTTTEDGGIIRFLANNGLVGQHDFGAIAFGNGGISDGGAAFLEFRIGGDASTTPTSKFLRANALNAGSVASIEFWTGNAERFRIDQSGSLIFKPSGILITTSNNSPEGVITAPVGSLCLRTNGGASSTLYVKESGTGNTGWKAVQTA